MSTNRVAAFLALLVCLPVLAEQWEGNAARIRAGEFATPGLFAASNSFPEGTRIRVSSARTGKSVEVTVTRRVNGTTGIFLLLSDQAADSLGLAVGDVERVVAATTVTVPLKEYVPIETRKDPDDPRAGLAQLREELKSQEAARAAAAQPTLQPPAPQPAAQPPAVAAVIEPAAAEPAINAEPAIGAAVAREPQKQLFVPPQEPQPPAAAQAPVVEPQPQPAAAVEPAAESGEPGVPENLVEFLGRAPQKKLFVPPREEEIAVTVAPRPPADAPARVTLLEPQPPSQAPAPAPTPAASPAAEAAPEVSDGPPQVAVAPLVEPPLASPEPPAEVAAAGPEVAPAAPAAAAPAAAAALGEQPPFPLAREEPLAPPPASEPPIAAVVVPAPAEPAPAPARPAGGLALTPTEPRPPQGEAPAVAARPSAAAQPPVPPLAAGDRRYVIQLAAFSDEASAREVQQKYLTSFPVDVQQGARNGRSYFRVVIGPLGRDETGSVLLRFQSLGYRDAFVRAIN
jgi:hypothetical protein